MSLADVAALILSLLLSAYLLYALLRGEEL